MLYYGSKILQQLAYPFNLALIALVLGWWRLRRGNIPSARRWIGLGIFGLVLPSLPIVGDMLLVELETAVASPPIAEFPNADAIVVLGGSAAPALKPRNEAEESGGARMLKAARLFKAGKAPLVFTSGGGDYLDDNGVERAEADDMADVLVAMGVTSTAVIRQRRSRTTYEDAVLTAEMMRERGVKKVLLVTSAFHQRRASALFRKHGFEVISAPSGFLAAGNPFTLDKLIPSPQGLSRTTLAVKEYVGFIAYRLMGKL